LLKGKFLVSGFNLAAPIIPEARHFFRVAPNSISFYLGFVNHDGKLLLVKGLSFDNTKNS